MIDGPQKKKTVYMLINGKMSLRTPLEGPVQATVLDISKRSIAELMRGLTYKTIYQSYVTARQAKSQFRLLYVPDEEPDIEDALRFKPKEMKQLFEIGRKIGAEPSNWQQEPPRLEALERVEMRASR